MRLIICARLADQPQSDGKDKESTGVADDISAKTWIEDERLIILSNYSFPRLVQPHHKKIALGLIQDRGLNNF